MAPFRGRRGGRSGCRRGWGVAATGSRSGRPPSVKGVATRFRVTNVDARTVGGGLRSYAAITQVADLDQATPTAAVGKFLKPTTTPNDTNGYWDVTTTRADGWAEITAVDFDLRFIEAQLIA